MCWWTKSQIACTRAQPSGAAGEQVPGDLRTACRSRSSDFRAGTPASPPGSCWTRCWTADGTTGSSAPVSLTIASLVTRNCPAGATRRVHQFPKPSRYAAVGTAGVVLMWSGAREVRDPAVMDVQGQDHRRGLGKFVVELVANADLHGVPHRDGGVLGVGSAAMAAGKSRARRSAHASCPRPSAMRSCRISISTCGSPRRSPCWTME